jgi:hypothetical protein
MSQFTVERGNPPMSISSIFGEIRPRLPMARAPRTRLQLWSATEQRSPASPRTAAIYLNESLPLELDPSLSEGTDDGRRADILTRLKNFTLMARNAPELYRTLRSMGYSRRRAAAVVLQP